MAEMTLAELHHSLKTDPTKTAKLVADLKAVMKQHGVSDKDLNAPQRAYASDEGGEVATILAVKGSTTYGVLYC